jgi:hypothetical protein
VHPAQVNVARPRHPIDRQGAALARLGSTEMPCWGDEVARPLSGCFTRTVDPAADREPSAPPVRTET